MALQRRLAAARQKARIGARVRLVVDGPSADHDWVFTGRLAGQAPEIDPMVYLTDADPALLAPGRFLEAEIVGAQGYDLIARPVDPDAH
jgi:ribosomal protein S12 methylthiotransferase